jgi:cell division protein FtsA
MNRKSDKNLIVGLDIGTSKIVAIVGEHEPGQPVEIMGIRFAPIRMASRRGVVVDIESTVQSIQRAIEEAELMAGCEIRSVYAGIAGSHIRCLNSHGIVPIRDKEVTEADREHVIEAARAVAIPADQERLYSRTPGLRHRRPGRHPPSDWHERRAPGVARAPGHRCHERRRQHPQMRLALRPARG